MPLSLQDLKSHLWNCAEILRGSALDRTDWKAFILLLLFFKRICDVWDEETAEAAETFDNVEPTLFPKIHRFEVPNGCHWRDIRETPANVGTAAIAQFPAPRSRPPLPVSRIALLASRIPYRPSPPVRTTVVVAPDRLK